MGFRVEVEDAGGACVERFQAERRSDGEGTILKRWRTCSPDPVNRVLVVDPQKSHRLDGAE